MKTRKIVVGEQEGWQHDEGDPNGFFHTFDFFQAYPEQRPRKIHIFLPRTYETDVDRTYCVIYTNDGQNVFFPEDQGDPNNSLQFSKVLNNVTNELISKGRTSDPFFSPIVVAVHATEDRDNEYVHEEIVEFVGGGLSDYTAFFCDDLKPWVDANYRTKRDGESTAVLGSSHGGLAAFYMATRRPDSFSAALCFSPSLWAGMDSNFREPMKAFEHMSQSTLIKECDTLLRNERFFSRPRFYLDYGLNRNGPLDNSLTEAFVEKRTKEVADLLRNVYNYLEFTNDKVSELMVVEDAQGGHDIAAWRWRLHGALLWLASGLNPWKH